ncbi:hypothetical protein BJ741DRAFT_659469 [Chytriomyces cf. hyalinus JEL632]|nr:hypothetical protein BJ741DRAFT_659469 [Chytriomyces cf. hyalinus JEL632]
MLAKTLPTPASAVSGVRDANNASVLSRHIQLYKVEHKNFLVDFKMKPDARTGEEPEEDLSVLPVGVNVVASGRGSGGEGGSSAQQKSNLALPTVLCSIPRISIRAEIFAFR